MRKGSISETDPLLASGINPDLKRNPYAPGSRYQTFKSKYTLTTIPNSDYITKSPKQSELPFHAKHTALKDKRSLSEKIENIDEVRDFLGEKYKSREISKVYALQIET